MIITFCVFVGPPGCVNDMCSIGYCLVQCIYSTVQNSETLKMIWFTPRSSTPPPPNTNVLRDLYFCEELASVLVPYVSNTHC